MAARWRAMFSIDYGLGGFGMLGFLFIGLLFGLGVIAVIWFATAVRGAKHIVEDEPVEQPPVQPPVEPHN